MSQIHFVGKTRYEDLTETLALNISKMVHLLQLANNHGTLGFYEHLIMHFLQGFSEIFLQQWSKYVCKYRTEAMSYEYPLM